MMRWSNRGNIENPKIDAFLDEIWEVCKRHMLALSHEDCHGSFEIVPFVDADRDWLMNASDRTEKK
jgi:hypothetical protein